MLYVNVYLLDLFLFEGPLTEIANFDDSIQVKGCSFDNNCFSPLGMQESFYVGLTNGDILRCDASKCYGDNPEVDENHSVHSEPEFQSPVFVQPTKVNASYKQLSLSFNSSNLIKLCTKFYSSETN